MAPNKLEQYPTQLEIPFQKTKDATPKEVDEWMNTDFFMEGKFSAMQMFVVIPAIVQFVVFSTMLVSFAVINVLF
jgi:hypothetical protein|tara:strand:- start:129 stop:353 length:225 start_codon:yes stop_codon:yes gene_type:complete